MSDSKLLPWFAFRPETFERYDDGTLVEFKRYTDVGVDKMALFFSDNLVAALAKATPSSPDGEE